MDLIWFNGWFTGIQNSGDPHLKKNHILGTILCVFKGMGLDWNKLEIEPWNPLLPLEREWSVQSMSIAIM